MPWSRVVTHHEEGEIQYLVTVLVTQDEMDIYKDEMDIYMDEMVAAGYLPTGTVIDQGLLHLTVSMRLERCLLIEDHLQLTRLRPDGQVRDRMHHHLHSEVVVLVRVRPEVHTHVLADLAKVR